MNLPDVLYYTKKATVVDILSNLKACDTGFISPLSERVNLEEYSSKLFKNSITFEAWYNNRMIGMVAAYFNNIIDSTAYITNVCVEDNFRGNNIASDLMRKCINYAKENDFKNILLEVNEKSIAAINLYTKFNFKQIGTDRKNIRMILGLDNP